jgi:4-amino-4-deoxy-L-arabinose transferase-like glycosyltransferase
MVDQSLKNKLTRLSPALLIAVLVAWHAFHNWLWLDRNIVLTGWDKARHLAQSLAYNDMLTPLRLRSLFTAFISDTVRPPLTPISAVVMYRLFGVSGDVAAMGNLFYLAVTLVATWKLGVLLAGRRLAVLSVVLLALLPMFYAMSRYFYLEFPLMAVVALTIWLLLASHRFQKRGTSLFFGLCLGLGLLTKRTYVAFVFAPVGLMVLSSAVLPALWQRLRGGLRIDLKHAVLSLVAGLALAAVWVVPSWATIRELPLGIWLYPLWAGLVALTIYLALRIPGPDTNCLAALGLGGTIGSLWYLANPNFLQRMLLFGYGVNDPRDRSIELGSLFTYTDYLATLVNQHLSLAISLILAAAAFLLLVALLQRGRLGPALRRVRSGWWAVLLWVVGPYLVLTLSIYHEARAITPVLPAIALLGGGLLLKLPWRKVRILLVALLILIGLVQFYAVSFEPLHGLVTAVSVRLPVLGQTSLLGWGGYLQRPDADATDHRYWIEPDVLQRMEEERLARGWEDASLGLLVNAKQINFEHFAYLALEGGYHPRITVERLARAHGPEPVYPRLYKHDYLLVKRDNAAADADSQVVIERILDDPPPLFSKVFSLDKSYPLPDGDTVYLYQRRYRPPDDITAEFFPELAQALDAMSQEGDAVVVIPPHLVPLVGQYLEKDLDVYPLSGSEPPEEILAEIAAGHNRVFVIYGAGGAGDLDSAGRRWLNEYGHRAWDAWFGPTQLVLYGLSPEPEQPLIRLVKAELGESLTLFGYLRPFGPAQTGGVLPLTLLWQALEEIDADYKVFVHLVEVEGQLAAQRDSEPVGGSRPTSTWAVGEPIKDRVGLLLPADVPPGLYELVVGMYDPATLERLPVRDADGNVAGDSILLGPVEVR